MHRSTVKMDIDDYIDSLYDRYKSVPESWKTSATEALLDPLCDLFREAPPTRADGTVKSPSEIIDNFCINAVFKEREHWEDESIEDFNERVGDNYIVKDDDYALVLFPEYTRGF